MNKILYVLLWIWQFPQNLAGLVFRIYLRGEKIILEQGKVKFYVAPTFSGGVSLGNYVFLSKRSGKREPVYDHEYGHCIQSRILGPLYLLIVGLCSGIHCLTYNPDKTSYYDFWTERWANKLGGIEGYDGEGKYHKEGKIHTVYREILEWYDKWHVK